MLNIEFIYFNQYKYTKQNLETKFVFNKCQNNYDF